MSGLNAVTANNYGIISEESDSEGVVVVEQKRRRVLSDEGVSGDINDEACPMGLENSLAVHVLLGLVNKKKPDILFFYRKLCVDLTEWSTFM
nr:hypothetical protein Iba_chr01bCG3910 [Ipomoea batatas]